MKLKSKISVITTASIIALLAIARITAQSSTQIVINWDVPGTISAQALTANFITSVASQTVNLNQGALDNFTHACQDWTTNAIQYRALNMPQRPKPAQPPMTHFSPVIVQATNPIKIAVTTAIGPDLLGKPCADLPPLPTSTPNNFVLGAQLGGGFYAAGWGDTIAPGTVVTGPDGKKYQKIGAPVGNGWYLVLQ